MCVGPSHEHTANEHLLGRRKEEKCFVPAVVPSVKSKGMEIIIIFSRKGTPVLISQGSHCDRRKVRNRLE